MRGGVDTGEKFENFGKIKIKIVILLGQGLSEYIFDPQCQSQAFSAKVTFHDQTTAAGMAARIVPE